MEREGDGGGDPKYLLRAIEVNSLHHGQNNNRASREGVGGAG
jgi:hypothetical protein